MRPQPYEHAIRSDLVSRLQSAFQSRYYGAEVRAFGSFASGVYLPTADIDLVLLSTTFIRRGVKSFCEKRGQIYVFAAFLKTLDIAVPNSIETIAQARVPILKFVDKLTGLKVDLSFDNDSGILANWTFQKWKSEHPAMPVIVSIIKQFLMLRGLNEVPTGGLGGFSIICLVTSLLQHLPHGHMEPNLGSMLMDFFDFYGNQFDYGYIGIRMDPPGYFDKVIEIHRPLYIDFLLMLDAQRIYGIYQENHHRRLTIEDPNNRDNDVSGGTKEIPLIFQCFSDAYQALKGRLTFAAMSGSTNTCFLGAIVSANYREYIDLRKHLRNIFENDPRFASHRLAPPPPPPSMPAPEDHIPPPPPQDPSQRATKPQRRMQASLDRAARLKLLRPDIQNIPNSIRNSDALILGGYSSQAEMDNDLNAREMEFSVSRKTRYT